MLIIIFGEHSCAHWEWGKVVFLAYKGCDKTYMSIFLSDGFPKHECLNPPKISVHFNCHSTAPSLATKVDHTDMFWNLFLSTVNWNKLVQYTLILLWPREQKLLFPECSWSLSWPSFAKWQDCTKGKLLFSWTSKWVLKGTVLQFFFLPKKWSPWCYRSLK